MRGFRTGLGRDKILMKDNGLRGNRRIRGILFDKDGTLFDFQKTWAPWLGGIIAELAGEDGALHRALARAWGFDRGSGRILPGSIVIAGSVEEISAAAPQLPGMTRADLEAHLNRRAGAAVPVPVAGLAPLLERFTGAGLRLGIATNESESATRRQMQDIGLEGFFSYMAGYDSGFGAKPAPGMCAAFARDTGLAPGDVLMVGDSPHDLIAGRAAGMRPIAVLSGLATREELAPLADAVLDDIAALPDWLHREGLGLA